MKQADIIRLGIIAIALLIAYQGIILLVTFIDFLFTFFASGEKEGQGGFYFIVKLFILFGISYLLIRNSRRISVFIDEQK